MERFKELSFHLRSLKVTAVEINVSVFFQNRTNFGSSCYSCVSTEIKIDIYINVIVHIMLIQPKFVLKKIKPSNKTFIINHKKYKLVGQILIIMNKILVLL